MSAMLLVGLMLRTKKKQKSNTHGKCRDGEEALKKEKRKKGATWSTRLVVVLEFDSGGTCAAVERLQGRQQAEVRASAVPITAGGLNCRQRARCYNTMRHNTGISELGFSNHYSDLRLRLSNVLLRTS